LYGTIFAATAAHSRLYADLFRLLGRFRRDDYASRVRYRNGFIVFLSVTPALLFLLMQSPVWMVKAGGIAQAVMLPVIGIGTLYLRHKRLPQEVQPSRWLTAGLWFAAAVIVLFMSLYAVSLVMPLS
jgi:hypothetical protein